MLLPFFNLKHEKLVDQYGKKDKYDNSNREQTAFYIVNDNFFN